MGKIKKLSTHLINQIAAGEVIERPASVVKELVENSLDAGADTLRIELQKGGKKQIRVTDNGSGIPREDLPMALKSHATSKLQDPQDLESIDTLGFRGEALASIASVSRCQITSRSREADSETAFRISAEGGELGDIQETAAPVGTTVDVSNLFYCTPARRKFLKNVGTEFGHCTDRVTEFSLAHPDVRFELEHDGERIFTLPGGVDTLERIKRFYGSRLSEQLIRLDTPLDRGHVKGFVGPTSLTRPNSKLIHFFLNGRSIQSKDLYSALLNAYGDLIPSRKKPVAFLFVEMDPGEVDVNVHPAKLEVRFRNRWSLRDELTEKIKQTIVENSPAPSASGSLTEPHLEPGNGSTETTHSNEQSDDIQQAIRDFFEDRSEANNRDFSRATGQRSQNRQPYYSGGNHGFLQIHDMFILEEVEDGLLVIDQHALHERILYHELHENLKNNNIPRQRLLSPAVVEVTSEQKREILDMKHSLKQTGLEVEEFGRGTVAVRSVPALVKQKTDPGDLLTRTLDDIEQGVGEKGAHNEIDRILRLISCHSAVKAGDPLQEQEIEELLAKRNETETSHSCVHGRPTSLKLSVDDLEKRFLRK